MGKFRNKPVVVAAVQLLWPTWGEMCEMIDAPGGIKTGNPEGCYVDDAGKVTEDCNGRIGLKLPIPGLGQLPVSGFSLAVEGDWIVREPDGKLRAYSPVSFAEKFEPLEERATADFAPAWDSYPSLAYRLKDSTDPAVRDELRALLADARADAVQYVHDVRADELRKAREGERERVLSRQRPELTGYAKPTSPMAASVRELSDADLLQALKNVGCHLDSCDACAETLFVGGSALRHTCPRGNR